MKNIGNTLAKSKDRETFKLTPQQQSTVTNVISDPSRASEKEISDALTNFDTFTKDLQNNTNLFHSFDQRHVEAFINNKDKVKKLIESIQPKVKLISKLMDQHGYEKSKDDIKLPEGFKFKDKSEFGENWGQKIIVSDNDNTMEMVFDLGKPGQDERYIGEIYYKVPGQTGTYSLGRRGIDVGLMNGFKDDRSSEEIIKEYADKVKQ